MLCSAIFIRIIYYRRTNVQNKEQTPNYHSTYQGEPVVFQSVMWKMTERFMNLLSSSERDEMNERVNTLKEETSRCHEMFNTLINKVGWSNMQFETLHYNDILGEINLANITTTFVRDISLNRYFSISTKV